MKRAWILVVGLLAVLAACSAPTPASPASPSVAPPTLDGTSWTVVALDGAATLADHQPTMAFADGSVAGSASCNRYNATVAQDGAKLTITPGVLTAMACADDVMTQEHAFTVALTRVAGARAAGDGVELVDAAGAAVLALAPVVDAPLEGTDWVLSGTIAKDAVTSVPDGRVSMKITDATLVGKACNTFRGTVTAADGSFKAGPLMSTKMACTEPELTELETTTLTVLEAASAYAIAGDTLRITADDGTGLQFTAK